MFANLVCPAKFLHYLQPSEYYISNTKVKEPDHEFQALLTNQRLLFLEGTQKKVRWSKRLRELITMDAVPENPQNLCITYHQDQEEAKEEEQSGKSILTMQISLPSPEEAEDWYWMLNRCLRDSWQNYFETSFMMDPEIYQSHVYFTVTEDFSYPGTFLTSGYTYLVAFSTTHMYVFDTYSTLVDVRNQLMRVAIKNMVAIHSTKQDLSIINFTLANEGVDHATLKSRVFTLTDRQKLIYETSRLVFKNTKKMLAHLQAQ
eukprot:TRINITY_DN1262_c1_g1_i2.p1 TRINITY_DN1262_c1_g1~~TRINITY_DN1262_c1_g1_i2.p1  ORF type:complete len:260 (-),score=47.40 TRINITY_DN1262_c1_g1_i2:234-1013(-)